MTHTAIIASHRRSGTHLTIDTLLNNSLNLQNGLLNAELLLQRYGASVSLEQFQQKLQEKSRISLIKTHTPVELAIFQETEAIHETIQNLFANSKIVYVYRDGRDVMVSLYHYMQSFTPELQNTSFADFLRMPSSYDRTDISRPAFWAYHVSGWFKHPHAFKVAYEDFQRDYKGTTCKIADFIGCQLQKEIISVQLHKQTPKTGIHNILRRLSWRKRPITSTAVQPRKGKVGTWHEYFSPDDLQFFQQETDGLLRQLGYEV